MSDERDVIEGVKIGDRVRHVSERARDGGAGVGTVTQIGPEGVAIRFDSDRLNEIFYPTEWFTSVRRGVKIIKAE